MFGDDFGRILTVIEENKMEKKEMKNPIENDDPDLLVHSSTLLN